MIFPSILFSTSNIYFSMIGMIVALILAYYEKGLLTVAVSAVLVVYCCELIFLKFEKVYIFSKKLYIND